MRRNLDFWGALTLLMRKEFRLELRSKQTLITMLMFGVVLTFMYSIGFETDPGTNRKVFSGVVWGALLFTGALGVGRSFAHESSSGVFDALMLAPLPRSAILVSKLLVNVILMSIVMIVVIPLFAVMLRVEIADVLPMLSLQVFVGIVGFCSIATPVSVIGTTARFPEVLLPMVVFPLITPVLIAGVKGTGVLLGTAIGDSPLGWVYFTAAFSTVFLTLGVLLFDKLVTE